LLVVVAAELGFKYRDVKRYSRRPDGSIEKMLDRQMAKLDTDQAGVGDWLLLSRARRTLGQHIACITNRPDMIIVHADDYAGSTVESAIPSSMRVISAYRFKELS
jgi:hypothetical protein